MATPIRAAGGEARRPRTTIDWCGNRDSGVLTDLSRFRGRAIGRRIKELLVMGLEAERLGMRASERAGVLTAALPLDWISKPIEVAPHPVELIEEPSPPDEIALSAEHRNGLSDLLDQFDD